MEIDELMKQLALLKNEVSLIKAKEERLSNTSDDIADQFNNLTDQAEKMSQKVDSAKSTLDSSDWEREEGLTDTINFVNEMMTTQLPPEGAEAPPADTSTTFDPAVQPKRLAELMDADRQISLDLLADDSLPDIPPIVVHEVAAEDASMPMLDSRHHRYSVLRKLSDIFKKGQEKTQENDRPQEGEDLISERDKA